MDGGGASSSGEVVVVVVVVVRDVVGYWCWRTRGGSAGTSLCKGGTCHSCRSALMVVLVVVVVVVVGGGGGSGGCRVLVVV